MPKNKSWVFLANYLDPTLLRNEIALFIGRELSRLDWTPNCTLIHFVLNGEYNGIYQLCEKIIIGKNRVDIDEGYLLEIDFRCPKEKDSRYFYVPHIDVPINIKDPEVEYDDNNFIFIKEAITEIDSILFSNNWRDPEEGWRKYIDIESFADWYIIKELAKDADVKFGSSCYMNYEPNGKLKMGPIWDFDMSFGNYGSTPYDDPTGFYLKDVKWYSRLFQDPFFYQYVKDRFSFFYNNRHLIYDRIDYGSAEITKVVVEDNKIWGRLCNGNVSEEEVKTIYLQKVDDLKTWIETRFEWLNSNL